ncbi:TPA: hypothetical protein EYP38_03690, partial [Candidatus Micrarchaeota archaeon]|nr:hypothetical protein [Candidatus Micrarchaeota archaeon]
MRKLAAALLTTTSLMLPGCSMVRNWGVETPVPSQLTGSVQGERDWYGLASHITDSSVFRHFEPIVAEMAGIPPVPADRINLVSDEELERICRPDAGGCYRINKEDIHIGEAIYSPGESENRMGGALCPVQERPSLSRNNRLAVWLHEQAHHFDDYYARRRINRWPDEIEAEAFVLYFGEHMARHYDRRLGVDIIHVKAYRLVWDRIDSAEDGIRLANELIADYPGERNPGRDTTLGRLSIIALLGSGEFDSFGDVWYYVHTHSHRQVMNK